MAKPAKTSAKKPNNMRLLYLVRILEEETNAEHGLTLPQIQERLEEFGLFAERKSLYHDFELLEEYGVEVAKRPERPVSYYIKSRLFEPAQLMLLIDAVQSSKSITKANSTALIKKLKTLVSKHDSQYIDSRVHVAGRVKMQNESVFATLDNIQQALSEGRDISFKYMHYDAKKNLQEASAENSETRLRTPLYIVYSNENYYMLAYDEEAKDHIRIYRVDRMTAVRIAEKSPKAHKLDGGFDIADYERQVIGMFAGKPTTIKLQVSEALIDNIVDLFGVDNIECTVTKNVVKGAKKMNADGSAPCWVNVRVKAAPNPVLFGYLAQFGGEVSIVSPKKVMESYEDHLASALKAQKAARMQA